MDHVRKLHVPQVAVVAAGAFGLVVDAEEEIALVAVLLLSGREHFCDSFGILLHDIELAAIQPRIIEPALRIDGSALVTVVEYPALRLMDQHDLLDIQQWMIVPALASQFIVIPGIGELA